MEDKHTNVEFENKKHQVFTPETNVKELLDLVGYKKQIYGKKVIDNACGDGNILVQVVRRYIVDSLQAKRNLGQIKEGLESDIYGAEIDLKYVCRCIDRLTSVAQEYGIYEVEWNILNVDMLKFDVKIKFDFVIGNPPYITYQEIDVKTRLYLKENYLVCGKGKFDYCYAFIESSVNILNDSGKLSYLIPSSLFKNVFAERLRDLILPKLTKIYDYTSIKLFGKVVTSSAIIVVDKAREKKEICYFDVVSQTKFNIKKNLLGEKWIFSYNQNIQNGVGKFGDYFKVANSVATLLNNVFVIKNATADGDNLVFDGNSIENSVIRKAASPKGMAKENSEHIIFPYFYNADNELSYYEEEEFIKKFPLATVYLKKNLEKLLMRKSDTKTKWFEYGRSQALSHLNTKKLLLSTVITNEVKVYSLEEQEIPYSGFYICEKTSNGLDIARKILESEEFYRYVCDIGINASGNSKRITVKDIANYPVSLQKYR